MSSHMMGTSENRLLMKYLKSREMRSESESERVKVRDDTLMFYGGDNSPVHQKHCSHLCKLTC